MKAAVLLALVACHAPHGDDDMQSPADAKVTHDSGNGECVPACGARTCGVDPMCGESCGTCQLGDHCEAGTCVSSQCVPHGCGTHCGTVDDGCGHPLDCGTCTGPTPSFIDIGVGREFSCALRDDHTIWCWGYDRYGQLGTNAQLFVRALVPVQFGSGTDWSALSVGDDHACGLRSDGRAYCWGLGDHGQLGDGGTSSSETPLLFGIPTGDPSDAIAVTAGRAHTCVVQAGAGILGCAGANESGELGDGTTDDHATPRFSAVSMLAAGAGDGHTCAVSKTHDLYCGGAGGAGQLANGSLASSTSINQRSSTHDWQALDLGESFTCGLRTGGHLYCWGFNIWGELGIGQTADHASVPTAVGASITWASVSAGARHACAIDVTGKLFCWGDGSAGQLGAGSTAVVTSPQFVGSGFARVSAGDQHTCAVKTDGTAWCWGDNAWGQLGHGDTTNTLSPVIVQ